MSSPTSKVALAVCLSILVGAFGVALGRRYCSCQPVVLADVRSGSSLGIASAEPLPAASTLSSEDVLVREAASTPDVDAKLTSMLAEVTFELFQRRTAEPLIVCRDAGVQHADQDLSDGRTYEPGEVVDLRFAPTLSVRHPDSLRADVVANGDRITVRARHHVFARGGQALVAFGQVFDVDRRCAFAVWR